MSLPPDGRRLPEMLARGFHDLRNPVAVARSTCEMLEAGWHRIPDHDRLRRVVRVRDGLDRIVANLNRLQLLVRLERDLPDKAEAPFPLRPLIDEIAADARATIRGGSASALRIVGDLPDIPCDRELVRALLGELLDNSIKFSPPGASVEIRLGSGDGRCRVELLDEGVGVPAGEEEAIFEPFRRGSNATDFAGSGLGLSLARRIATRFGGDLSCLPGLRGHFVLVLPIPGGAPCR